MKYSAKHSPPLLFLRFCYDEVLSDFRNIDEVAGTIVESPDYQSLADRILDRFRGDKQ